MKKFIESEFGKDISFDQAYGTDENGEVDWGECTEAVSRSYFLDFRKTDPKTIFLDKNYILWISDSNVWVRLGSDRILENSSSPITSVGLVFQKWGCVMTRKLQFRKKLWTSFPEICFQ